MNMHLYLSIFPLFYLAFWAAVSTVGLTTPVTDGPPPSTGLDQNLGFSLTTMFSISLNGEKLQQASYQLNEVYGPKIFGRSKIGCSATSGNLTGGLPNWHIKYSNEKERVPRESTFYVATSDENWTSLREPRVFLIDEEAPLGKPGCKQVDPKVLDQLTSFGLVDRPKNLEHIAGAARVLFMIDANRDKMRLLEDTNRLIFNQQAVAYKMSIDGFAQPKYVKVFYSRDALEGALRAGSARTNLLIPLEVTIRRGAELKLSYRFTRLKLESDLDRQQEYLGKTLASGTDGPAASFRTNDVVLEKCNLPTASSCSALLLGEEKGSLRASFPFESIEPTGKNFRFAFNAQVKMSNYEEKMDIFVAYESQLGSLRVDRTVESGLTSTLTSYQLDRLYHVVQSSPERLSSENVIGKVLEFDSGQTARESGNKITSCVVSKAFLAPIGRDEAPYSLGRMLLGAEKFLHVGRSIVRGLEARMYEAYDTKWPVWLNQPLVVVERAGRNSTAGTQQQQAGKMKMREADSGQGLPLLKTVVHVSVDTDHPLLMEIFMLRLSDPVLISRTTVTLFNFDWQLPNEAPDGRRVEELFSLADLCSANEVSSPEEQDSSGNHYGKVEMLLARDGESSPPDWLRVPAQRNYALLQAIQLQLNLPSTMVYDLESQLFETAHGGDQANTLVLPVAYRLMEHTLSLSELHELGLGEPRSELGIRSARFIAVNTNFQSCFFLAAHRRSALVNFAFDAWRMLCLIDLGEQNARPPVAAFEERKDGMMQLYQVRRTSRALNQLAGDSLTMITHGHDRLKYLKSLTKLPLMRSSSAKSAAGAQTRDMVEFLIRSFEASEDSAQPAYQLDGHLHADSSKFVGLGYSTADSASGLIWRLTERTVNSDSWQGAGRSYDYEQLSFKARLNFNQCQTGCLTSLECRSFSYCVHGAKIDCILSKADLRSSAVVAQLMTVQRLKLSSSDPARELELDGGAKLPLKRHPNCELHQKKFIELFNGPYRSSQTLAQRELEAVADREQCARLCFGRTVEALRDDLARSGPLASASSSPETIQSSIRAHRESIAAICREFFYLDALEFSALPGEARNELLARLATDGPADKAEPNGYCAYGKTARPLEATKGTRNEESHYFPMERYSYDFMRMFEKQYGVRLRQSFKSAPETLAYARLTHANESLATRPDYDLMQAFVERGDNTQLVIYGDYAHCAAACFMQTNFLWPACRSFDLMMSSYFNKSFTVCHLNTISLTQALRSERFDLIEDGSESRNGFNERMRVWHFEPRPGFVQRELQLAGELEGQEARLELGQLRRGPLVALAGLLCLVFASLAAGVLAGLELAACALAGRLERADCLEKAVGASDTQQLVVSAKERKLEFENLVNFDGLIPDERAS